MLRWQDSDPAALSCSPASRLPAPSSSASPSTASTSSATHLCGTEPAVGSMAACVQAVRTQWSRSPAARHRPTCSACICFGPCVYPTVCPTVCPASVRLSPSTVLCVYCLIFSTCARADPSLRDLTPVHGIVASISTVCTVPGLAATRAIGHRVGITKYTESNPELSRHVGCSSS